MERFEDESDINLLIFLQFIEAFSVVLLSNLILYLWKIKHDALQPVVMGERQSIPWAAQPKCHPRVGDKNRSSALLLCFAFRLWPQRLLPLAII